MKRTAILLTSLLSAATMMAVPAKPGPVTYTQPDGTQVTLYGQGDEHHRIILSEDGYLLMGKDGAYNYAELGPDGNVKASKFQAMPPAKRSAEAREFLRTVPTDRMIELMQMRRDMPGMRRTPGVGLFEDSKFPSMGEQRVLVILAEYQDRKFVLGDKAHDYFDGVLNREGFNERGATGSARDWFAHGSNGQFAPVFDVYGPVTLSKNMSYYGQNTLSAVDPNAYKMIIEACQLLDDQVDFSQYDRDGDGFIDNVYLYYAGLGEAQSYVENTVWPHSYNITYAEPDMVYKFDGVQLDHYATSNEWVGTAFDGSPDGIGTFVHEFSHVIGLPDLYSTTYNNNAFTTGQWSVMDQGCYNNNSRTPTSYGAFERNALGWLHPTVIGKPMSAVLPPIGQHAAFVIETSDPDEFFLLENRQKEGWDAYLPHHGMLIWHVQYDSYIWSNNTVNNVASHQYVDIEEADGIADKQTISGDPYPGTAGITSFTGDTRPAMKTWGGVKLDYPITDIVENGDITFNVLGGGEVVRAGSDDETPFAERQVTATDATSVTLDSFVAHWLRLKDAESYEVQVLEADTENLVAELSAEDLEVFVGNLKQDTEYYYVVRAVKGEEKSLLSEPMHVRTLSSETRIPVYNYVTFYDGYNVIPADAPDEDDCIMLHSYLKTKKLSDEILDRLGSHLTLEVDIHARCDNYDRIGSVNLAFLPKGTESYAVTQDPAKDPVRVEIARYITPFMDKNKEPSTVTYTYLLDNVSSMLRDPEVRDKYDIWLEFELFGVPYAANEQIAGCAGCVDVFGGSMTFITDAPAGPAESDVFVPITIRDGRPDRGLNNYNESGTDEIGKCIKTFTFDVPTDVKSGRVVVVMSNHGANTNGEEYNRRNHKMYWDGEEMLKWKPGRTSCEPYREFNTQPNGIYGSKPKSDTSWQLWSNWCPGAPIPFQSFELNDVKAGEHSITIEVLNTKFPNQQGYFPFSAYFQGDTEGTPVPAPYDLDSLTQSGVNGIIADDTARMAVVVDDITLRITTEAPMSSVELYDLCGMRLQSRHCNGATATTLDISTYPSGAYILKATTSEGPASLKLAW